MDSKAAAYITTSWDDGSPLDLRVAELLSKWNLRGTFYVPRCAQNAVMSETQMRQLGSRFELGAHTLSHVPLTQMSGQQARQEILGSKQWLENVSGRACTVFCPPLGRFGPAHLRMIGKAGFSGARTVEFFSLDMPRAQQGLWVMPTTVQAHPHRPVAYVRNIVSRAAVRNLWLYIRHGQSMDWGTLAERLLEAAQRNGGVFHLWGHSWELEENGQWRRLEEVLRILAMMRGDATALTNGEICDVASAGAEPEAMPAGVA